MTSDVNALDAGEHISYVLPSPTRASKAYISNFAEQMRKKTKITHAFQLPDLVKRNKGKITYISFFDDDQTDAIVVMPDNSFEIKLSAHTGALRDNFTIAHELGHRLLHWPIVRKLHPGKAMHATRSVDTSKDDLVRCEWEANWFAASFLMPENEFKEAYSKGVASETFGVTDAAVEVRAKNIGITN